MKKITQKMTGWFPILKTGKLKDSRGREHTFTKADLDNIAAAYNEKGEDWKEAPCVTGHPATNSPAYGWIESARRIGNKLYARAKEVVPDFASQVKEKMYKYVSPSFRPDGSLRHVGFLGGTPPAIPGLGEVTPAFADFGDDEELDTFAIDFAEMEAEGLVYINENLQKAFAALKKYFSFQEEGSDEPEADDQETGDEPELEDQEPEEENDEPGMQKKDDSPGESPADQDADNKNKDITDPLKEDLMKEIVKTKGDNDPEKKEESPPGAVNIETQAGSGAAAGEFSEPDEKDAKIAELQERVKKLEIKNETEFAEGLVKVGKLLPKHKPGFVKLLTRLDDTKAFDFAEEDAGGKDEKTVRRAFMDFAEAAFPVQVPLTKINRGPDSEIEDNDSDDFSEADLEERNMDQKIKALMKKKDIDYQTAFNELKE